MGHAEWGVIAQKGIRIDIQEIYYEGKKTICRFLKFYDVDKFGELFISLNCGNKGPTVIFVLYRIY